ncbi:AAA family ATPase [Rhodoferax sp. 4810]|uniref:AAA family ATPase n=1 Tax=Thiospirillum jenense TaxID=1653858 RepID=A0A839H771_9GAMM|nr:ATP-binding protein [Thiospirillum jenense]MBB1074511.1 AAA family ATPase [Rhodoferax jenense]MBB1125505.1 AAA family ATPase [Thiospirillum jenense]
MFRKAERKQSKLRLAICGPSGSGKTYSALLIAQGLTPNGRIALVDTERGSGELYSNITDYDVAQLTPPYTPQRYIDLINASIKSGYEVLIIDSISHAWTGDGGVLDMHSKASTATRNSFTAWRDVTPKHNSMVDAIIGAPLHVIVTMRTKTAYEMTDENGKKKPMKIGLAPIQRDGMEYEFTTVFDLAIEQHLATASKDRTGIFDGQHFVPSVETGFLLRNWLESGAQPAASVSEELKTALEELQTEASTINTEDQLREWWAHNSAKIRSLTTNEQVNLSAICKQRIAEMNNE